MKKILAMLGALTLMSSTTATVVACGNQEQSGDDWTYNLNDVSRLDYNNPSQYKVEDLFREKNDLHKHMVRRDFLLNNLQYVNKQKNKDELVNYLYRVLLKELSYHIVLFEQNIQDIELVKDEFLISRNQTDYHKYWALEGLLIVQENIQSLTDTLARSGVIFDHDRELARKFSYVISYLHAYDYQFYLKSNIGQVELKFDVEQNWTNQEIVNQFEEYFLNTNGVIAKYGVDFDFFEPIKRDSQDHLVAQPLRVYAKWESKLLRGTSGTINVQKDMSYLRSIMNWNDGFDQETNKRIALNEILRWMPDARSGQDYLFTFEDGVLVLKFAWNGFLFASPLIFLSDRVMSAELQSLTNLKLTISLVGDNEAASEEEVGKQVEQAIFKQMGIKVQHQTDFVLEPKVKRDDETNKILGQELYIRATLGSDKLWNYNWISLQKDFSYLRHLEGMDWSEGFNYEANKKLAIEEINRYTERSSQGFHYDFYQVNGIDLLRFNQNNSTFIGADLGFATSEELRYVKKNLSRTPDMKLSLVDEDDELTDSQIIQKIESNIKAKLGIDVVYGLDFTIDKVQRNPENQKLLGQVVEIKAVETSLFLMGSTSISFKKDFSYLYEFINNWGYGFDQDKNQQMAREEIKKYTVSQDQTLNEGPGQAYWFEINDDGFLTLYFNPDSQIASGKDLVFKQSEEQLDKETLTYLNYRRANSYTDQDLVNEQAELAILKTQVEFLGNNVKWMGEQPNHKQLVNFMYQVLFKELSLELVLFEKNYQHFAQINDEIIKVEYSADYEKYWKVSELINLPDEWERFNWNIITEGVSVDLESFVAKQFADLASFIHVNYEVPFLKKQYIDDYWMVDFETSHNQSDAEIIVAIERQIFNELGVNAKYGVDFEFVDEITRDENGNVHAQAIKVYAKYDSTLIQGTNVSYIQKDFSYLKEMLNWQPGFDVSENKQLAIDEIKRWAPTAVEGLDYAFYTTEEGILYLKFAEFNSFISGETLFFTSD